MASSQQYQTQTCGDSEKPKGQIVTVCCKAYPNEVLGIKDCGVALVPSVEVGMYWEKVEVEKAEAEKAKSPVFVLVHDGKALAHGAAGHKVGLKKYNGKAEECMCWTTAENKSLQLIFIPISTPGDINVENKCILNLDVNQCREIVVEKPFHKESQLWNISLRV